MSSIESATFFGANYKIAQMLRRRLPLNSIVCENRKFNQDIFNFAGYHKLNFTLVDGLHEVDEIEARGALGVACGFGLIFKKNMLRRYNCGIWNIHYGKLPQFRGRHPVSWALLSGEQEVGVTVHEIDEHIDRGYKLAEGTVQRDLNDGQVEIEAKIERILDEYVLDAAIRAYRNKEKIPIGEGTYFESLGSKLESVNPAECDSRYLFDLFQSQRCYGGISVNGQRYTGCAFWHPRLESTGKHALRTQCKDGVWVVLTLDGD